MISDLLALILTIGSNRGGMEECYHGPCDIYNHADKDKNNISWDFLVKTTQTLIGKLNSTTVQHNKSSYISGVFNFLICRYSKGSDTIIL